MSVDTLSSQDTLLAQALHSAKRSLQAVKLKPGVDEREVRNILQDIACDAQQPLPLSIVAYMPHNSLRFMSEQQFDTIIAEIDRLGSALLGR